MKELENLFLFAASSFFLGIGQFTRLLPSVEVVAVSQAPAMAVHYTAITG